MSSKAAIVVPAIKRHTSTIIVAHGLGDSGAGWHFLAEEWRSQDKFPETKFIFPNAPTMPVTANGGMRMPAWYDIFNFEALTNRSEDEAGILRSQKVFHQLIADEVKAGIPSDRIVLGGFSQGGAMGVLAGVTAPTKLGGIFGLSCYLLLQGKLRELVPADAPNQATPIFLGHGDSDPLVKPAWGKATGDRLKEWGYKVDFKVYPGIMHGVAPQEIDDLERFIAGRIPDQGEKGSL